MILVIAYKNLSENTFCITRWFIDWLIDGNFNSNLNNSNYELIVKFAINKIFLIQMKYIVYLYKIIEVFNLTFFYIFI